VSYADDEREHAELVALLVDSELTRTELSEALLTYRTRSESHYGVAFSESDRIKHTAKRAGVSRVEVRKLGEHLYVWRVSFRPWSPHRQQSWQGWQGGRPIPGSLGMAKTLDDARKAGRREAGRLNKERITALAPVAS
jgi:hypothetical protein